MKIKSLARFSPFVICMLPVVAHADLEPFSFGASETIQHDSNIYRSETHDKSDWLSTTELRAAVDEAIGRQRLLVAGTVDLNRYKSSKPRDSTGYDASAELDWSTVGDLAGAIGADSHRTQYIPGESEVLDPSTGDLTTQTNSNLQTTHHAFARASLGGDSRWRLFVGADANRRDYSSEAYRGNDERQWSANGGTSYSTSPDLSFGLTGAYSHGEYPNDGLTSHASKFSVRSFSATTRWQASGNSSLDASVGYTDESSQALTSDRHFVNGSLNWVWTPPSRFKVTTGLKRSSDADTGTTGINTGVSNANNLNGASINNIALLDVTYELSAKVSLDASAQYTQRKYTDFQYVDHTTQALKIVNGATQTTRFYLSAHYLPTRTTDVSCGVSREARRVDAAVTDAAHAYTNNSAQCTASIKFE